MKTLATILLSIALCGCATTGTVGSNDADAYVRMTVPKFSETFNRADWTTLSTFYTDDAVVLAPHAELSRGPAAIAGAFGAFQPMQPRINIMTDRVVQSGDTAYEYGTYTMQLTSSGRTINDRGKYLTVWRRMPDGTWKIAADAFNTSLPPPGM